MILFIKIIDYNLKSIIQSTKILSKLRLNKVNEFVKENSKRNKFLFSACFLTPFTLPVVASKKSFKTIVLPDAKVLKEDQKKKKKTFLQFCWLIIKNNILYFIISIFGSFVLAYLNIKIPISLGNLTNKLLNYVEQEYNIDEFVQIIKLPALILVSDYILQALFTTITISSLTILGERISVDLKKKIFNSIISQDVEFFDRNKIGTVLTRLNLDIQEFKSSFKIILSQGLKCFTQVIGSSVSLYLISPKMSIFFFFLVPSLVTVGSFFGLVLRKMSKICQEQTAKCSALSNEAISSIRTIKASAMEEHELKVFDKEVDLACELNQKLGLGIAIFQGLTNAALNGIIFVCLMMGGQLISRNEISPGDLMSFLAASQTIQKSLTSLSLVFGHYIKWIMTGERILEYLSIKPNIISSENYRIDQVKGEVLFDNISFAYPTRKEYQIFENFTLKLEAGKITAICGSSGVGKSTLAQLLERFYDIDSGSIKIDKINLKRLDLNWLRSKTIGYINQEPTLFASTILENIRYANPEATDQQVYEAAKAANVNDFIESLPQGYQTVLGERGTTLSGGQKQRIAIARAILKNPAILILDEATSALDSQSEMIITEALEKLMKNKTVLIIAHRLSTIKNADVILVISNGKIIEKGTHDELIKNKGFYWELTKKQ